MTAYEVVLHYRRSSVVGSTVQLMHLSDIAPDIAKRTSAYWMRSNEPLLLHDRRKPDPPESGEGHGFGE